APPPLVKPLPRPDGISSVEFSADGQLALMISNQTIRLWNTRKVQPLGEPRSFDAPIHSAQFDPNRERLAIVSGALVHIVNYSSRGGRASLGDVTSDAGNAQTLMLRHDRPVQMAEFDLHGKWIATVSANTARIWDSQTGAPTSWTFRHEDAVESAHFSSDGHQLVTASRDHSARVWEIRTGRFVSFAHAHPVLDARLSPDGRKVATASTDGSARIWDAATGRQLGEPLH